MARALTAWPKQLLAQELVGRSLSREPSQLRDASRGRPPRGTAPEPPRGPRPAPPETASGRPFTRRQRRSRVCRDSELNATSEGFEACIATKRACDKRGEWARDSGREVPEPRSVARWRDPTLSVDTSVDMSTTLATTRRICRPRGARHAAVTDSINTVSDTASAAPPFGDDCLWGGERRAR